MRVPLLCGSSFVAHWQFLVAVLVASNVWAEPPSSGSSAEQTASKLVRQALDGEIVGNAEERREYLDKALATLPDYAPARWHSGYVRINNSWLSLPDAELRSSEQGRIARYRQLRDKFVGSLVGETKLARWCREQKLDELEKFHWGNVLRLNSANQEARSRLGLREYGNLLLTTEQIALYREWRDAHEKAIAHWKPRLMQWRSAIDGADSPARDEALSNMQKLNDMAALPALEQALSSAGTQFCLEGIATLGRMDEPVTTDLLVRFAVCSDHETIRMAATEQLKSRSWYGIIPNLLGSMDVPATLSYYVASYDYSVGCALRVIRDSPTAESTFERYLTTSYSGFGAQSTAEQTQRQASKYRIQLAKLADDVAQANERTRQWNDRVCHVLRTITGQNLDDKPDSWWRWWEKWNELEMEEQKPTTYAKEFVSVRYAAVPNAFTPYVTSPGVGRPGSNGRIGKSCFLPGTQVWTDTGAVPIEQIRAGDRVLAQDQQSGELSYKIVQDTTIRPPSPSLRIGVGGEEIAATLGHPIWVVGKGWLMAKELKVGYRLHGVSGAVSIEYIEQGPESEAHNLVVADFNTYFVGKNRVMVHDNNSRPYEDGPLPGYPTN